MKFLDQVKIFIKAGDGGSVSAQTLKFQCAIHARCSLLILSMVVQWSEFEEGMD